MAGGKLEGGGEGEQAKKKKKEEPLLGAPSGTSVVQSSMDKAGKALDEEAESKKKVVGIKADEATQQKLIDAYKKFYAGDEEWLKKNPPPKPGKEGINLPFKSEEDLTKFLQSQAQAPNNQKFILVDAATQKVIGFSNGDGNLYKYGQDGKPHKHESGPLLPTKEELDKLKPLSEFKMPTQEETAELRQEKATTPTISGSKDE